MLNTSKPVQLSVVPNGFCRLVSQMTLSDGWWTLGRVVDGGPAINADKDMLLEARLRHYAP